MIIIDTDKLVIGYDIFSAVESYNHDDYYDYAKDSEGKLYKCHYGSDGDGDWYITCFEKLEDGEYNDFLRDELIYYKRSDRLPFEYVEKFTWEDVKGLSLDVREIEGQQKPCFIRWKENKCYIINCHEEIII